MKIELADIDKLQVSDDEIRDLLYGVYVRAGFTDATRAAKLFDPVSVRQRGYILAARDIEHSRLAGMVILVSPQSPACKLAKANEAEIHLLGVKEEYRGNGVAKKLVIKIVEKARAEGFTRLILWTQPAMLAAQRLYEGLGFVQYDTMSIGGRDFKVYQKPLNDI